MDDADQRELNPYASPTLLEAERVRPAPLFPIALRTHGTITWEQRRQAFLIAYGVSNRDLGGMLIQALIAVCFGMIIFGAGAWMLLTLLILLVVTGLAYLRWRRYRAHAAARQQQVEQAQTVFERVIDEQGITAYAGAEAELSPWTSYSVCRIERELILLVREDRASFQIFPREHFASLTDWNLFHWAVRNYVRQL